MKSGRKLSTLLAVWLGLFSGSVAHAQIADRLLMQVASWLLQKQIEEYEKANDPNRPLKEFDARDRYDSGRLYAPREQFNYQPNADFQGYGRSDSRTTPEAVTESAPQQQKSD